MNTQKRAALYCRLSREDEQCGSDNNSNSITNQILLLTTYALEHNFQRFEIYIDDGYSGTSLDRPDINRLVEDIESGLIDTVIVKDRSRIGRNYVEVGKLTNEFFLEHRIRLISVLDGSDSANGADEFSPFRDIMNEWYAKDISKKAKASLYAKGRSCKRMITRPIFGYKNDENGDWIIDDYSAEVVRRVFRLFLDGYGVITIANILTKDNIPTPMKYQYDKIVKYPEWSGESVRMLLNHQEYVGDTLNFKTYKMSYKSKKIIRRPKEEFVVFPNTHEPIVSRETFELAQKMMKQSTHRNVPGKGIPSLFSGLPRCTNCGSNLVVTRKKLKSGTVITSYVCSTYRHRHNKCTSHYIREDQMTETIKSELEEIIKEFEKGKLEKLLVSRVVGEQEQSYTETALLLKSKKDRADEIDTILKGLYEDKLKGTIPNDVFLNLYSQYKSEQDTLNKEIYNLSKNVSKEKDVCTGVNRFIKTIKGYATNSEAIQNLTREDLLNLINHIDVYSRQNGETQPKVEIHYHHVGYIKNLLPNTN